MKHAASIPPHFPASSLWYDLLVEWQRHLARYERDVPLVCPGPDIAYWYTERTLSGILAGAAWSLGGWGIVEFSTVRHDQSESEQGWSGHGDMWIGRSGVGLTVEAKVFWAEQSIDVVQRNVLSALDETGAQLAQIERDCRVGEPFSVCYIAPCFRSTEGTLRGRELIEALQNWASVGGMASASHIPDGDEKGWEWRDERYPGVLLVVRHERCWT